MGGVSSDSKHAPLAGRWAPSGSRAGVLSAPDTGLRSLRWWYQPGDSDTTEVSLTRHTAAEIQKKFGTILVDFQAIDEELMDQTLNEWKAGVEGRKLREYGVPLRVSFTSKDPTSSYNRILLDDGNKNDITQVRQKFSWLVRLLTDPEVLSVDMYDRFYQVFRHMESMGDEWFRTVGDALRLPVGATPRVRHLRLGLSPMLGGAPLRSMLAPLSSLVTLHLANLYVEDGAVPEQSEHALPNLRVLRLDAVRQAALGAFLCMAPNVEHLVVHESKTLRSSETDWARTLVEKVAQHNQKCTTLTVLPFGGDERDLNRIPGINADLLRGRPRTVRRLPASRTLRGALDQPSLLALYVRLPRRSWQSTDPWRPAPVRMAKVPDGKTYVARRRWDLSGVKLPAEYLRPGSASDWQAFAPTSEFFVGLPPLHPWTAYGAGFVTE